MNVMTDAALRSLDAAPATMTQDEHQRATVTLERILATSPSADDPKTTPSKPRRPSRRLVLVPIAAGLAVGAMVVPGLGGQGAAFASWSATPTAVEARDLGPVEAACRDQFGDWHHARSARLVLAERRGDFVTLLYHSDNPELSASCVARNPQGTTDVTDINTGIGGSDGPAMKPSARSYTQGPMSQIGSPQTASVTDGAVGQDVKGVTIHAGSRTVKATVHKGRYVAWWPGPAFGEGAQADSFLTYDLTLTDGTTIRNAQTHVQR